MLFHKRIITFMAAVLTMQMQAWTFMMVALFCTTALFTACTQYDDNVVDNQESEYSTLKPFIIKNTYRSHFIRTL